MRSLAEAHATLTMPSHTHGQPASPTTLGKELAVFAARWQRLLSTIRSIALLAKFNGAVGTYSAHVSAYPEVDWIGMSRRFVESFGLAWNPLTTQIESHDALGEMFHAVARFNAVVIDFCRDMWEYISRGYLQQRPVAGEVGSSTMPHKVNPIDFENAEGNAGISSALLEHLASKLMISRMQRDLSDSSAIRNMGAALSHSGLALRAARLGLARVSPAPEAMAAELGRALGGPGRSHTDGHAPVRPARAVRATEGAHPGPDGIGRGGSRVSSGASGCPPRPRPGCWP